MCSHQDYALKKFPLSNGRFHKIAQCNQCGGRLHLGENGSYWIKAEPGEDISKLPLYDAAAAERWIKAKNEQYQNEAKKREIEKAKEWQSKHEQYEGYITGSQEWQQRRRLVLERARSLCEACLLKPATQVHHVNYDSLYAEVLFDLRAVCSECHKRIHGIRFMDLIK